MVYRPSLFATFALLALMGGCSGRADAIGGAPVAPTQGADASGLDAASPSPDGEVAAEAGTDAGIPDPCDACQELASGLSLRAMVVNETSVYWTLAADVTKVSVGGGATEVVVSGQPNTVSLALDPTNIYWTTDEGSVVGTAQLDGGAPTTLTSGGSYYAIAVDATNAYFAQSTSTFGNFSNYVLREPKGGGPVSTLAATGLGIPGMVFDMLVGPVGVYWTTNYECDGGDCEGNIMTIPLDGGTAVPIATNRSSPSLIAVDATNVIWLERGASSFSIVSAPVSGGASSSIASAPGTAANVVRTPTGYFWAGADTIMGISLDGGTPGVVAPGQSNPQLLRANATSLFWVTSDTPTSASTLKKIAIPN